MKRTWIFSAGIALVLLAAGWACFGDGASVRAEDWSLAQLNPFAKAQPQYPAPRPEVYRPQPYAYDRPHERTPLEQVGAGTKKIVTDVGSGTVKLVNNVGSGTKKVISGAGETTKNLFVGARDALSFNKPDPAPAPPGQVVPWMHDPNSGRYRQYAPQPPKEKRSWLGLDSLFRSSEPAEPAGTWKEWWDLDRIDP